MEKPEAGATTNGRTAWLATFVLGIVLGVASLELGFIGVGFVLLAFGVIAWKGPQLIGAAGFICGFAGIWLLLLANVFVHCDLTQQPEGQSCGTGITGVYVLVSIALLVFGVGLTVSGIRRGRHRAG